MCVRARACVRVCVRACVRVCVCVTWFGQCMMAENGLGEDRGGMALIGGMNLQNVCVCV